MAKRILHGFCVAAALAVPAAAHAALTIDLSPTANVSCAGQTCTATAADAVLNAATLKKMLRHGDVAVAAGTVALDVVVDANIVWTSSGTLTLDAGRSILIERNVVVQGTGGVALVTNDGGTGGDFRFAHEGKLTFLDTSSALAINGQSYVLASGIASLASDMTNDIHGHYALAADYDAAPDGTYAAPPLPVFDGTFEGLGHTVSNFAITVPEFKPVGLFPTLLDLAVVRDLALENVSLGGNGYGGPLAGANDGGLVHRVATSGQIAVFAGGGLVGTNGGTIEFSQSSVSVTSQGIAGGLMGINSSGTIAQSFATGAVIGKGDDGGLIGESQTNATVTACYSRGSVTSSPGNAPIGGFIGDMSGSAVSQSYETGWVGGATVTGGFAGQNNETVDYGYWDTTTTGMRGKASGTGTHRYYQGIYPIKSKALRSALPAGFDPAIWSRDDSINNGFPYLLANPPR